ncbi:MAG: MFS transporter [Candidatus Thermoplasmatota archaeon]|jgi:MFS family permease|uniref:MFS transporter n=1 Tax=Ferroplasma sp. TaxID=2591003 RepID=UPI001833E466|nr:MFS transporter [Ferroplasma sp.]MCL4311427.1 MFS transporter [Candidatus Thermoplasmatota archaeon]HIH60429.1 MFS transporter [Ferroplasma sp.]HII82489.1 MFS transporter [Ferroplasma sp.]
MADIFDDLDKQKFGWFHARSILTTGMGVFTDGYDLSSVGIVLLIILSSYGITSSTPGYVLITSLVAGTALIGAAAGALVFGELARRGRVKFYGVDVLILGVGALMQIFAVNVWVLIVIRLILGIGVGADYVMSPIIMGEHSNAKDRGKTMGFGFGMMWGFGALTAAFTFMVFGPILGVSDAILWRIVLAAGAIPALAVVYLRRRMPETPRFIARIAGDKKTFEQEVNYIAHKSVRIQGDIQDKHNFKYYFHKYKRQYIAAMLLWFFYDQVAYAGILFGPTLIAKKMGLSPDAWTYLMEVFTIVGGIVMLALIDRKGRKFLQIAGFMGMGIFLLIFEEISGLGIVAALPIAGMLVYGIGMNFFNQAGPGSITASGLYGVELAPAKIRSQIQSYTVSAGRTGAAIATFVFPVLFLTVGEVYAFYYLAALAMISAVVTLVFIPETKGALEDSSNETNEMKDVVVAGSK